MLGLTIQEAAAGGGIAALLSIVGTFCWTWRHRSLRKTLLALERERKTLLAAISPNPPADPPAIA